MWTWRSGSDDWRRRPMARRSDHRLKRLEDTRGKLRTRRNEQDDRDEQSEAAMEEVRSTPEGVAAEQDLAGHLREHDGDVVGVLRSEGGREAARAFRDALFGAQDLSRNNDEREVDDGG